jgi:transcriptional regulator with XRE-family HTH domain
MALMLYTENEFLAELGHRLKEQRLRKNMLQKDLASRTGISVSALKKLESQGLGSMENFMKVIFALRLERELHGLFQPPAESIAQVEALREPVRKRARRLPQKK